MQDLTWKAFRDRLGKERDRFVAASPPISEMVEAIHPEVLLDWFGEMNDDTRANVRAAVSKYVTTKKWPTDLSPKERASIILRLEWAMRQANCLMCCPGIGQPSMDIPEEHVLSWFLLSSWECAGFSQIMIGMDMSFHSLQGVLSGKYDDASDTEEVEPTE